MKSSQREVNTVVSQTAHDTAKTALVLQYLEQSDILNTGSHFSTVPCTVTTLRCDAGPITRNAKLSANVKSQSLLLQSRKFISCLFSVGSLLSTVCDEE